MEVEVDETVEVQSWRLSCLERAGCSYRVALQLALEPDVDLHQAVDLLAAGCTPELLLEILT